MKWLTGYRDVVFVIVMCLLGTAALSIDLPVTNFFRDAKIPSFWRDFVENTEPFGHGIGAFFILLVMVVLDVSRRKLMPWAYLAVYGAGITTNILKLFTGRVRPRDLLADAEIKGVYETFRWWLEDGTARPKAGYESFPSGHSTSAFALACVLSHFYPRGRYLFFFMAILVAYGRVQTRAHYLSDVCFGAALGWGFATVIMYLMLKRHPEFRTDTVPSPLRGEGARRADEGER